jgi:hypothetical protein
MIYGPWRAAAPTLGNSALTCKYDPLDSECCALETSLKLDDLYFRLGVFMEVSIQCIRLFSGSVQYRVATITFTIVSEETAALKFDTWCSEVVIHPVTDNDQCCC